MNVYTSIDQLIGKTPLVELTHMEKEYDLKAKILAKIEGFNPAGSAKDRVALAMIEQAEREGKLSPGATIVEPTSGNTGIALCALAAVRGYRAVIVMPDNMSVERIRLMKAYGAEVVLTPAALGMSGAIDKARELASTTQNSFIPDQFANPANPAAHFDTTGPEIWTDTEGGVDVFIAGVGTGGTISGTGAYLKQQNPAVQVVAVEPAASPLLSKGQAGVHGISGIGANFVPSTLDRTVIDKIMTVTEDEAFAAGRLLARREGILSGISSGAALHAAIILAQLDENEGKTIVVLLPDTGERYLSTPMFQSIEKRVLE
ncbi:MAG: cysteine synthase A [Ruminococcaceae bacterium]|nr:cysteine synthase A [Oscillospiraceae bacterium]